jgi:hypothetical protein
VTPEAPVDPGRAALSRAPGRSLSARSRRRGGRGAIGAFLLANAIPAAAAVWFFTRPAEQRRGILDAVPPGVGTRAATAGIAFGVLLVLALAVLPGARAVIGGLQRARAWLRARPAGLRALLFPAEAAAGLLWFLAQCLFAVDAVAILAAGAAFLVYVARIVKPDLLPGLPG